MWTKFSPIFWATQKGLRVWSTVAFLSPLIPLILWCFATQPIENESDAVAYAPVKVAKLAESRFVLKERPLDEYLRELAEGVHFLGLNQRPDCVEPVATIRLAKEDDPFTLMGNESCYLQVQQGKLERSNEPTPLNLSLISAGVQLALQTDQDKTIVILPKQNEKKGEELLWVRRQIERWRYLGVDKVQEFLGKNRGISQIRLFDEMQQRLVVLTDHDTFTLKDGKLVFTDKGKSTPDILCMVKRAVEGQVEIGIWDSFGVIEERCLLPLYTPEKMAAKVESLFIGAKRFGLDALWLRKEWKQAVYVGDWLLEERGDWGRPTKERLEDALQGRYKGALAYFASLKKEGEKWVAEIFVFDSLHIHKERILVPIDSRINVLSGPKRSVPVTKEMQMYESQPKRVIPKDRTRLPKALEAMLDEMDQEEIEGR